LSVFSARAFSASEAARIHANHGKTKIAETVIKPGRQGTRLKPNKHNLLAPPRKTLGDHRNLRVRNAAPNHATLPVQNTDMRALEAHVQTDIISLRCSPSLAKAESG
jgi:hypothetical protein